MSWYTTEYRPADSYYYHKVRHIIILLLAVNVSSDYFSCLEMCEDTRKYQKIPEYIRRYQNISEDTRRYQKIPEDIRRYQKIPEDIRRYQKISQAVILMARTKRK